MNTYQDIMKIMDNIEYGFKDELGFNIINDSKRWNQFSDFYYLLTPNELLEKNVVYAGIKWS